MVIPTIGLVARTANRHSRRHGQRAVQIDCVCAEIAIEASAGDFRLTLPAQYLARGRANVIGRNVAGGREVWSDPVEVVFDDEPPTVKRVLLGSRRVVAGTPLRVTAETSDGELSGAARIPGARKVRVISGVVAGDDD